MHRRIALFVISFMGLGCASTAPYEQRIQDLEGQLRVSRNASREATEARERAEREARHARATNRQIRGELEEAREALAQRPTTPQPQPQPQNTAQLEQALARAEAAQARIDELQARMRELSDAAGGEISQYGGVCLEAAILFPSGRHELTAEGQRALQPLVSLLTSDRYADYEVELAGHTDSDPVRSSSDRYRDNHDLAGMRANSVRRFLIQEGIPEPRVYLSAFGAEHPVDPSNKAMNRRVEIVLHPIDPIDATSSDLTLEASSPR